MKTFAMTMTSLLILIGAGRSDEPWRAAGSDQTDRHHVESIDSTCMNITV
jgi:hypothetical protein